MPLKAIRTRLRLIRYYSRPPPSGRWNRAHDIALAAALVLAWPMTWLLDRAWVARSAPVMNSGFLYRGREGQLFALTATADPISGRTTHDTDLVGAYQIDLTDAEHGWPFVTSLGMRQGTIDVQLFEEARRMGAADLPPDSPVRAAIEDELADTGQSVAAAVVWGSESQRAAVSRRAGAWLANGIVWSLALVIAARLLVSAARIPAAIVSAGRAAGQRRRASTGRCAGCGYDLRGSAFGERCPECGVLL
jgi:hypothetical protein